MKRLTVAALTITALAIAAPAFAKQPPPPSPETKACRYLLGQGTAREVNFATAAVAGQDQVAFLQPKMTDAEKQRVDSQAQIMTLTAKIADLEKQIAAMAPPVSAK